MKSQIHRLGDVLDDYCTACRLLMNHAVVGMVKDKIKKVRCQTCMLEHSYRFGRLPKKRDTKAALYKKVSESAPQERPNDSAQGVGQNSDGPNRRPRSHSLAAQLGVRKQRPTEVISPSVQIQPPRGKLNRSQRPGGQSRRQRKDPMVDPQGWMGKGKLHFGKKDRNRGPRNRGRR